MSKLPLMSDFVITPSEMEALVNLANLTSLEELKLDLTSKVLPFFCCQQLNDDAAALVI
jgi:hypothetical protein